MSISFAPEVLRQRLLVEGHYRLGKVNEDTIREFFKFITGKLGLRVYGDPIIFSPGGARVRKKIKATMPSFH